MLEYKHHERERGPAMQILMSGRTLACTIAWSMIIAVVLATMSVDADHVDETNSSTASRTCVSSSQSTLSSGIR
jgi:hypothetical protein